MGIPVVASSQSLGGLDARDGVNLLVRDSPRKFAEAVVELLADPLRADALGTAGRQTVEAQFSWQRRASAFEQVLADACSAHLKDAVHA